VALIRFSQFTDPRKRFLINEKEIRTILADTQVNAQASGDPLKRKQILALEELLPSDSSSNGTIHAGESTEESFDPKNVVDARKLISRTIAQRRGQRTFRDSLIAAYGSKCVISGCGVLDVLEAAHIYPYRGPATNKVSNGLLLRADLHTLFDCNLIAVDPCAACRAFH
jgi:putative restriction endonuclease